MTTASETVSRWSRRFVTASLAWFVCWQVAAVAAAGRPVTVTLGLYGFVLHAIFGKGYALVPTYFDRELAVPRASAVHLPVATLGTAALAMERAGILSEPWGVAGDVLWGLGCGIFVVVIAWSVRDNISGRETGTSRANADRSTVDRIANGFVPVVLGYLLVAAVLPIGDEVGVVPASFPAAGPPLSHLFAAGTAALLVFALGFRLLPRFLVVAPRTSLVALVLSTGAIAPLFLVSSFGFGRWFRLGAGLEAVALVGFAVAYADMFVRSERRRVGLSVVLVAAAAAVGVGLLGVHMAWWGPSPNVADVHARLALLGFLGLTVVGVSYQFYPPAVASLSGVGDRTALFGTALLAVGVGIESLGLLGSVDSATTVGRWSALSGAIVHAAVVLAVFWERRARHR
jgi:hypothetical protein